SSPVPSRRTYRRSWVAYGMSFPRGRCGVPDEPELTGPELARAVLDAARVRRAATPPARRTGGTGRRLRGYSGPGPDPRDPQPFGSVLARLIKARGWERPAAEATVFGDWPKVV